MYPPRFNFVLNLPTNLRVFEGFLRCPNCQREVTKTELFLNFGDTLNLKCSHCQNEDLNLDDFFSLIK